ncbi:MAG TPA: radical SAM protein [Candidatus Magasanikbacteria bacterium]|nr:radical SAM protein [Candidatus Magasanikbacteria bacterium]
MKKCKLPIDCVLGLTYRCNSRCVMCDIWKIKDYPELTLEQFEKLPSSLRDINLSGGEPFLRSDLPEIVKILNRRCPKARMVISSNGFATELIVKQMKEILKIKPDIGVAISIDGLETTHDEMRGIPGGFQKAMATVSELKKLGMTNLRLGFTVMEKNINQMEKVYDLTKKLGIEFTHSFAQSSDFYFGGKQNEVHPRADLLKKEYEYLINSELKSWNVKKWLRAFFAHGMYNFITSKTPVLDNAPGRDFFFLDPNGTVYPSVVHNVPMTNINELDKLTDFWCSKQADEKRENIDALKIPVWMICTARTAIRKHPLKVIFWILKNKIFGFKIK